MCIQCTFVPLSRCTLLVGIGSALRELCDLTVGTKGVEPVEGGGLTVGNYTHSYYTTKHTLEK